MNTVKYVTGRIYLSCRGERLYPQMTQIAQISLTCPLSPKERGQVRG